MDLKNAVALYKRPINFTERDSPKQMTLKLNDFARQVENRFTELEHKVTELEDEVSE